MQTYRLKWGVVLMVILELSVLTGLLSSAEAVLTIRSAAVVNGVAVVEGGNAPRAAPISWEGTRVTQANNGGNFAFQGVVPADCVGRLEDGVPADAIDVALANCEPVSGAPAPVPQTGQTTCWDAAGNSITCNGTGQDGDLQAGVAWPVPRFTDNGDGTVRDNLTGLIWLKDASCIVRTWVAVPAAVADLNAGTNFSCVDYEPGTFADWRLPNIRELHSLINLGFYNPALSNAAGTAPWTEGDAFSNVRMVLYWSSTSNPEIPYVARVVDLHSGSILGANKDFGTLIVWPVRGPE